METANNDIIKELISICRNSGKNVTVCYLMHESKYSLPKVEKAIKSMIDSGYLIPKETDGEYEFDKKCGNEVVIENVSNEDKQNIKNIIASIKLLKTMQVDSNFHEGFKKDILLSKITYRAEQYFKNKKMVSEFMFFIKRYYVYDDKKVFGFIDNYHSLNNENKYTSKLDDEVFLIALELFDYENPKSVRISSTAYDRIKIVNNTISDSGYVERIIKSTTIPEVKSKIKDYYDCFKINKNITGGKCEYIQFINDVPMFAIFCFVYFVMISKDIFERNNK